MYIFKCIHAYTWNYKLVFIIASLSLSLSLSLSPNIGYYQFLNFGQVCLIHPYIQSYFSIQNISYFKLKKFALKSFSMETKGQNLRLDCLEHLQPCRQNHKILYNREWDHKNTLQWVLYTWKFFWLMNSSSSSLMGYYLFFKSFFSYYNNQVVNKKMLEDV